MPYLLLLAALVLLFPLMLAFVVKLIATAMAWLSWAGLMTAVAVFILIGAVFGPAY